MTQDAPPSAARSPVEWLVLAAALLHLWEVDGHGRAWWGYGAFFVAVVVGQASTACSCRATTRSSSASAAASPRSY